MISGPCASGAVGLEMVIRAGTHAAHADQMARLAARLGYHSVWLADPPEGLGPPDLPGLVAAAAPAYLGLLAGAARLDGPADPAIGDGLLYESPEPPIATVPVTRVHTAGGDTTGYVVHSRDRDRAAEAVRELRARPLPAGMSVAVDLPVVFGRTLGEARARLERDPWLRDNRDPVRAGLYGTFGDVQAQITELAMAGADRLRAVLADEADVGDLLAQLRAVTVGPVPALIRRKPAQQEVSR
jgi:hypothetical protein